MSEAGFDAKVTFTRNGAPTGRDAAGRPTYTPTTVATDVDAAVGLVAEDRRELAGGGQVQRVVYAVHVPTGTNVEQGDTAVITQSPWAGTYKVEQVRILAIHVRVLVEGSA